MCYFRPYQFRGCSSAGRASRLQREGRRFDPCQLHNISEGCPAVSGLAQQKIIFHLPMEYLNKFEIHLLDGLQKSLLKK